MSLFFSQSGDVKMKRYQLKEFESLVMLLEGTGSSARNNAHMNNLLQVRKPRHMGSGYLLTRDGFFVTNYHVLDTAENATAGVCGIPHFSVKRVLMKSKPHDLVLAQLELNAGSEPTVSSLASQAPQSGDSVKVYGSKYGYPEEASGRIVKDVASSGISELIGKYLPCLRERPIALKQKVKQNTFYTDCSSVCGGWSGGPVVNEKTGEIIGLTRAISSQRLLFNSIKIERSRAHEFIYVGVLRQMISRYLLGDHVWCM